MKKVKLIMVTLLMCLVSVLFGQTNDTLNVNSELNELKTNFNSFKQQQEQNTMNINIIQTNLYKSHKIFNNGLILIVGGVGLGVIGGFLIRDNRPDEGMGCMIVGSGLNLLGVINVIRSHKFIGEAANNRTDVSN